MTKTQVAVAVCLVCAGTLGYLTLSLTDSATTSFAANLSSLTAAAIVVLGTGTIMVTQRRHLLRQGAAWMAGGLLLIMVTPLVLGGLTPNGQWGISDWDYYFSYHTALRRIVLDYHTFPHWNPYLCGGTSGIGDPEFPLFTPTFLLELLLGVPRGLRLSAWLATAVGAVGMLTLGKRLNLSLVASLLAALIFSFSSVNILEIVEGHTNIFSAMWVPWIFWAWLNAYTKSSKSQTSLRIVWPLDFGFWCLVCGIFLALTFFQGGIYMLMYVGIAFLFLLLALPQRIKSFLITLTAGGWALGLSAIKLIPVFLWLTQFQDAAYASSTYILPWLHYIVLGRYLHTVAEIIPNQGGGWHEYGAYIGPFAAALILTSVLFIGRSKQIKVLALACVLAISIASAGPLLKPLFDHTPWLPRSNISRFMLFAILPGALLAGITLDKLTDVKQKLWPHVVAVVLLGLVAIDLFTLAEALSYQPFRLQPIQASSAPPPPIVYTNNEYVTRDQGIDYTRAYAGAVAGFGTMSYCAVLGPPPAVKVIEDASYEGYAIVDHHAGKARVVNWTPNQVTVEGTTNQPDDLILNSNYAQGWKVNNVPAKDNANRLAAVLPTGTHRIVFSYRAPGWWVGLTISLLTILIAVALSLRRRYHHKVS